MLRKLSKNAGAKLVHMSTKLYTSQMQSQYKLECFVPWARLFSLPSEWSIERCRTQLGSDPLLTNIGQSWKGLSGRNGLAYLSRVPVTQKVY